jgi:outer membrane biosynthesis protein TonB
MTAIPTAAATTGSMLGGRIAGFALGLGVTAGVGQVAYNLKHDRGLLGGGAEANVITAAGIGTAAVLGVAALKHGGAVSKALAIPALVGGLIIGTSTSAFAMAGSSDKPPVTPEGPPTAGAAGTGIDAGSVGDVIAPVPGVTVPVDEAPEETTTTTEPEPVESTTTTSAPEATTTTEAPADPPADSTTTTTEPAQDPEPPVSTTSTTEPARRDPEPAPAEPATTTSAPTTTAPSTTTSTTAAPAPAHEDRTERPGGVLGSLASKVIGADEDRPAPTADIGDLRRAKGEAPRSVFGGALQTVGDLFGF